VVVEKVRELPEELQQYIHSLADEISDLRGENSSLSDKNTSLEAEIENLREKLRLALFRRFGRSSEKIDPNQQELFAEAEESAEAVFEESPEIEIPAHNRKKAGRKPLDPDLPREVIVHDLEDEEKICGCGSPLSRIGQEVREQLVVIPEQFYVERHVYPTYACRPCEGSGDEENPVFRMAEPVKRLLPGSIASPALLAFVLTNKFVDHLPFYRQEKRFERIGARVSRQDMSNWTIRAYQVLKYLEEIFIRKIKEGPLINMDETPLQVLCEPGRADSSKSYMWLARGGPPESPLVLYRYHTGRDSDYIKDFLNGFSGYLQTDGLQQYQTALKDNGDVVHVGCLAHARRRFHDASKASSKSGGANVALSKIQKIYLAEKKLREVYSGSDLIAARKKRVLPLLESFKEYLDKKSLQVRPSSGFGEAISYTLGQWSRIEKYIDSPYLTPDNNVAERAIRPFVVGRKNWLFSGSPRGAVASCFFYSLIETAKANDLNPYGYLKWLFETAPGLPVSEYEKLLPANCDQDAVSRFALLGRGN